MIEIDGATGEGGGQILRTALTLSILTRKPFRIHAIRAGRDKPGLQPQHLAAVKAATQASGAHATGAELYSEELTFQPGEVKSGAYPFDLGTAGSTTLVAQTLLPALLYAPGASHVTLTGGTANPHAPSALYLNNVFLPALKTMGVHVDARILRWGFYPKGGGRLQMDLSPLTAPLVPFHRPSRGALKAVHAYAVIANLPAHVAQRELDTVKAQAPDWPVHALPEQAPSDSPGNELTLILEYEKAVAGFSSLGRIGVPAEQVALDAVTNARAFDASGAAADAFLSDQLLLYAALADGRSEWTTPHVTSHLLTNAWTLSQFLPDADVDVEGEENHAGTIRVDGVALKPRT